MRFWGPQWNSCFGPPGRGNTSDVRVKSSVQTSSNLQNSKRLMTNWTHSIITKNLLTLERVLFYNLWRSINNNSQAITVFQREKFLNFSNDSFLSHFLTLIKGSNSRLPTVFNEISAKLPVRPQFNPLVVILRDQLTTHCLAKAFP